MFLGPVENAFEMRPISALTQSSPNVAKLKALFSFFFGLHFALMFLTPVENAFEMRPISALTHSKLKALNYFPQAGSHWKYSHERFMFDKDHQLVIVDGWGVRSFVGSTQKADQAVAITNQFLTDSDLGFWVRVCLRVEPSRSTVSNLFLEPKGFSSSLG